jgi:hypothetical protein
MSSNQESDLTMELAASENVDLEGGSQEQATKLPRADGGKDAWLFLAGCFVFEDLVWGE